MSTNVDRSCLVSRMQDARGRYERALADAGAKAY